MICLCVNFVSTSSCTVISRRECTDTDCVCVGDALLAVHALSVSDLQKVDGTVRDAVHVAIVSGCSSAMFRLATHVRVEDIPVALAVGLVRESVDPWVDAALEKGQDHQVVMQRGVEPRDLEF